jgi:hypothetical protein
MRYVFAAALAVIFSAVALSAHASGPGEVNRMVTVPQGAKWILIGEWDFPGQDARDGRIRFTRSIIEMGGKYFRVFDGTLIAGCCPWPVAYELVERSKSTYWDSGYQVIYAINEDGTLSISGIDGTVTKVNRTPGNAMLSNKWR